MTAPTGTAAETVFWHERRQEVASLVTISGRDRAADPADHAVPFGVSGVTIRRDPAVLEAGRSDATGAEVHERPATVDASLSAGIDVVVAGPGSEVRRSGPGTRTERGERHV